MLWSIGCSPNKSGADLIFYNGIIYTVNATDNAAQAMATQGDKIIAVGKQATVMLQKRPHTRLVDLKGKTIIPGFVGAHEHPTLTAVFNSATDLSGFKYKTNKQVWQALKTALKNAPKDEWFYGRGLDLILTPDLKVPTRQRVEDEIDSLPELPDNSNSFFRILGIKLWHDGSPYTGGMFLSKKYKKSKLTTALGIPVGSRGHAMITSSDLVAKIEKYSSKGWQVAIHSQGDASAADVSHAINTLRKSSQIKSNIRMEHLLLVKNKELKKMAKNNIFPSFHINHILYYGDALQEYLKGKNRAQSVLPVKTAFELGMHPTLHADSPMFPTNAFSLMQTAVLRKTAKGKILNGKQAVSLTQALRAMTINGARQLGIANQTGSLEPGKWADFQIINENPFNVKIEELHKIESQAVYVAGQLKTKSLCQ